jgi:hypothetical protein
VLPSDARRKFHNTAMFAAHSGSTSDADGAVYHQMPLEL